MNQPRPWRIGAVAAAIALLGSLASLQAHALALGRVTVQSALGEPLRAEIEVAEINAEEAASLSTSVAGADAFKAAGLEYSAAVTGVQITLQRRADGRSFLRLRSDRPITEPFVDLIVEARWSSGRIVRDYTMLFDPPNLRQAAPAPLPAPTAPMVSRAPTPQAPPPVALPPVVAAQQPFYPSSPPPSRPAPVTRAPAPQAASADRTPSSTGQTVTVKAGDTAGRIAAQNKPANVSLDQMLVALLRSNPDAFIGGNINRLKAGTVLEMPGADQAEAVSPSEASRTIVAQSKDFNNFRRQLAEGVPTTRIAGADRQATGQVQAKVDDKATAAATPDKLTLSKGALKSKSAAEEKIAQDRQSKEAAARVAELSKNIADLNKLTAATPPPAAAAVTPPAAKPAATATPAPAPVASPTPAVVLPTPAVLTAAPAAAVAASAPAAAPVAAMAAASAPVATPAAAPAAMAPVSSAAPVAAPRASASTGTPAPKVAAPPPEEPGLIDELLGNPLILAGGAGLLLLLGGLSFYRARQRKNAVSVDSSFLESRLQPDSFFGASGGQRVDTAESNITGSSMVYSPSQLDAAGDVDPVAEADVYLAYGRDLQAEEILKEAIRVSPGRIAIHAKLMEIYAKRRDTKSFESVAAEAFNLTKGQGIEWAHMAEMGRDLDPANPMYQPGGQPSMPAVAAIAGAAAVGQALQTMAQAPEPAPEASGVDFDLDLDFSLDDEPAAAALAPAPVPAPAPYTEPTVAMQATAAPAAGNSMDFSSATLAMPAVATAAPAPAPAPVAAPEPALDGGMNFTLDDDDAVPTTQSNTLETSSGMLEFDLGALSLDLDSQTTESQKITTAAQPLTETPSSAFQGLEEEDPLETKFSLAEEFRAIGDVEGARSLAEEVLAQSSGTLKGKAQAFLNALS